MTRIPRTTPPVYPDAIPDTKFASTIERDDPTGCAVALLGIPDDTGIAFNNGRPGAREGPAALRAALATMGTAEPNGWDWPKVFDAGDIEVAHNDLHATHDRVTEATSAILDLGLFPIAIGGGHDLTFPFVRAVSQRHGAMHGIYFDPHLDVRETDGSGMPFRALVECGAAASLRIHGFDPMSNSRAHTDWFLSHGGRIDEITGPQDPWSTAPTFVSLDLDVLDAAHAPGVSAMNPNGWTPDTAARWAHAAGAIASVACFDIMELSPPHDDQGRTARLAARLLLTFLRGYAERTRG